MFLFGAGVLIGTPAGGGTPVNFGLVQEVHVDVTSKTVSLYAQYDSPVCIAQGERKITGKAKIGRLSASVYGSLFYGIEPAAGTQSLQLAEMVPLNTVGDYTVAKGAQFVEDQGAVYAATGFPLRLIGSGVPAVGQYKIAGDGDYAFHAADIAAGVLVSYVYEVTGEGSKIAVSQRMMGQTQTFSARLFQTDPQTNKLFGMHLYACVASKLTHGTKLTDFTTPEIDFEAFSDPSGRVLDILSADKF